MAITVGSTSSSLLDGLRDGDAEAWKRMATVYGPLVYALIRKRGFQEADAKDLSQVVFQNAFRGMAKFQKGSFRGWLATITRNVIQDHFREAGDRLPAIGGSDHRRWLDQVSASAESDSLNSFELRQSEVYQRVLELVEKNSDRVAWQYFREVVIKGRQVADVAQEYGVTQSAVYKGVQRVIDHIQTEYGGILD